VNIYKSHTIKKYFGHIKHHSDLKATLIEGMALGRLRKRWIQSVKEALYTSIDERGDLARDRTFQAGCEASNILQEISTIMMVMNIHQFGH
jgi:hypothetical protein